MMQTSYTTVTDKTQHTENFDAPTYAHMTEQTTFLCDETR